MMIHEGDGTIARRLAQGLCPKCQTALTKAPRSECRACGLVIDGPNTQDNLIEQGGESIRFDESAISMMGALR
jgi:predicted amidophosphoribosyltransferase